MLGNVRWGEPGLSVNGEAFSCSQGRGRATNMRTTGACNLCSRVVKVSNQSILSQTIWCSNADLFFSVSSTFPFSQYSMLVPSCEARLAFCWLKADKMFTTVTVDCMEVSFTFLTPVNVTVSLWRINQVPDSCFLFSSAINRLVIASNVTGWPLC